MCINLKKTTVIALIILIIFSISFSISCPMAQINRIYNYTIVLDAGHGGVDGGVKGVKTGVKESDLNLKVVKKLQKLFESSFFKVVLTREDENGLYGEATKGFKKRDMKKRAEIINNSNANIFLSIHMNKFCLCTRRGPQVFYKNNSIKSKKLAMSIQDNLNNLKTSTRNCIVLMGDYYVLNTSNCPSVLIECGFLSNYEEEQLLVNDEYQNELAQNIYKGVYNYFVLLQK